MPLRASESPISCNNIATHRPISLFALWHDKTLTLALGGWHGPTWLNSPHSTVLRCCTVLQMMRKGKLMGSDKVLLCSRLCQSYQLHVDSSYHPPDPWQNVCHGTSQCINTLHCTLHTQC